MSAMRSFDVQARIAEIRALAESAREKKAAYGPDLDLSRFNPAADAASVESLESLEKQVKEVALGVGIDTKEENRSGTYFQVDRSPIYERVTEMYGGKLEIMSTAQALELYPELMYEKYYWRAVAPDKDKYTAQVALQPTEGYFIRVLPGQKIEKPIQACLFVSENNISQNVHNVIIMEEGSEATVITGCTIHPKVREGLHAGISEFYVGKGAKLTFTMIHNWAEDFDVRPRTGIVVEEDGTYINNYVLLKPVKSIQSFPVARLVGARSRAVFNSIVYGLADSHIDIGSESVLEAPGSRSEAVARTVTRDRSIVYSRGRLVARTNDCKAHLDCRGMVQSEESTQWAIPDLASEGAPGAELSHEAAISPIAAEEIYYLMSRGVPKDEAVSMITRGFLDLDIPGLPPALKRQIDKALEETAKESM
ncbi:SufD family Fe-S cluster assembly protein [Coriobacteriia bacterium Es71-Z0120]|uniref:SufB/SufD family protein n=1 Tax=Parvivirga hydrogeniphila TaxID=2939460 RepID=UPI002260E770|nr:SufD family Fe-S cluster assembly protein [Parvivirga hydrogeniphila]MCL4078268.1 SufD family Fe-S cluster assembly protein [Parvivirga hydrogeniphila]